MTESVLSKTQDPKSSRIDPPHDLLSSASDEITSSVESAPESWLAFAGRDPEFTTQQVDRQASELLAYVQEQNKEIDVRQAELNAKLAQLDNQLRSARLRADDAGGTDLLSPPDMTPASSMLDSGLDLDAFAESESASPSAEPAAPNLPEMANNDVAPTSSNAPTQDMAVANLGYAQKQVSTRVSRFDEPHPPLSTPDQEFEEVERLVAQFSEPDTDDLLTEPEDLWNRDSDAIDLLDDETITPISDVPLADHSSTPVRPETTFPSAQPTAVQPVRHQVDAFPAILAGSHLGRIEASRLQGISGTTLDPLESERRLLADRKLELERQHAVVTRMQQETQALHREALEMRIVTEQLWSQLSDSTPPEQLTELLSSLRSRLDQQYAKEQATLDARKHEIQSMHSLLEQKQSALRDQSSKLQDWMTEQQEEVRSQVSELEAKEMLLDRREHRLQDEFAKLQTQRNAHETQLQNLAKKLNLGGLR